MTKTTLDTVTAAMRRLGVAAVDVPLDADNYAIGEEALTALYTELNSKEGFTDFTDVDAIPDWAFLPLAQMLANELAPNYGVQAPQSQWWEGFRRLRRHAFPDTRTDPADVNSDGTVTAQETKDDLYRQWY